MRVKMSNLEGATTLNAAPAALGRVTSRNGHDIYRALNASFPPFVIDKNALCRMLSFKSTKKSAVLFEQFRIGGAD